MSAFRILLVAGLTAGLVQVAAPASASGIYTTLYTFTGGADGAVPNGLTLDAAGDIYGTTEFGNGGYASCINFQTGACGTVFKLSPSGQLTTFANFTGPNGAFPTGPLTLIGTTLYGTTGEGGPSGDGEIFSINTDGSNFDVLFSFSGKNGANPGGSLLPTYDGSFYGVASNGGPFGAGELFRLNKDGTFVILHAFKGRNSWQPNNLVYGPGGIIFGSTSEGGDGCPGRYGCGTLFSYNPKTPVFNLLYQFTGRKDGELPTVSAVDAAGDVYGATQLGSTSNQGTLFELAAGGNGSYTLNTLLALDTTIGTYIASGPILLPKGQLVEQSLMTLFLYDAKIPGDTAVLATIPNADFSSSPTLGPDGTLYGSAAGSGPYYSGQIYSYTRPGAP